MTSPKPYIFTDDNPNTMDDYALSVKRLARPEGAVDVVLDTDMFNEVDDQYALAYLLQYQNLLRLKAIFAAPFSITTVKAPATAWSEVIRKFLKYSICCIAKI